MKKNQPFLEFVNWSMCLVWYALVSKEYKRREIPATDDPEQPEILPPYGVN